MLGIPLLIRTIFASLEHPRDRSKGEPINKSKELEQWATRKTNGITLVTLDPWAYMYVLLCICAFYLLLPTPLMVMISYSSVIISPIFFFQLIYFSNFAINLSKHEYCHNLPRSIKFFARATFRSVSQLTLVGVIVFQFI